MPTIDPVKDPEDEQAGKIGKAWQAAIDFGIDVSLLEENLRLTPEERLAQLVAIQRLFDALQPARDEAPRETT
jgi:hypothetical protein